MWRLYCISYFYLERVVYIFHITVARGAIIEFQHVIMISQWSCSQCVTWLESHGESFMSAANSIQAAAVDGRVLACMTDPALLRLLNQVYK